jgi:hypothetical protein
VKRLFKKLDKKYPSLRDDLLKLITELQINPRSGINLGNNIYKIRMAVTSKGRGKSGGTRVITFFAHSQDEVYLVHIYDKGQLDNITKQQIMNLVKNAGLE